MSVHRFFRSAKHPEFMEYEIKPHLVERGLTTALAPTVAGLMDCCGLDVESAVREVEQLIVPLLPIRMPLTTEDHPDYRDEWRV